MLLLILLTLYIPLFLFTSTNVDAPNGKKLISNLTSERTAIYIAGARRSLNIRSQVIPPPVIKRQKGAEV